MNLSELILHPERMDRETLYDLRSLIALYPYYQTARLLMLQNLYLLHDPTFNEELRRAAIYITDRKVLFRLIESAHYKLRTTPTSKETKKDNAAASEDAGNRTTELIDNFLGSVSQEDDAKKSHGRKPTPTDASVDYVAYLMECGESETQNDETPGVPKMKGQNLIDDFINRDGGRIILPELDNDPSEDKSTEPPLEGVMTETMAQIYIRQGRYSQALEIIKRLNLDTSKKNAYFADQIRFLEKLIVNNNNK